jgi:hypothetical protein
MWFFAAHQVDILQGGIQILGQRARPYQARYPVAQKVYDTYPRPVMDLIEQVYDKGGCTEMITVQVPPAGTAIFA